MARFAVLCVLFACFAVAVYSQTCNPTTYQLSDVVANKVVTVDATKVTGIKGVLTVADGAGSVSLDYQKNQGFVVTKTAGVVTVVRTPPVTGANQLGGVSVLVTLGLAALALVSQRGSLVALVLALAIATVVIAACGTATTLEVNLQIDPAQLDKFTLKVAVDGANPACPPAGYTIAGANAAEVISTRTGTVCDMVWSNPLPGCPRCPNLPANQQGVACTAGKCDYTCAAGFQFCNGNCATSVTDAGNCGSCGNDCSTKVSNVGGATCVSGACDYSSCLAGFDNCDSDRTNGCETDVSGVTACGGCSNDCTKYPGIDTTSVTCSGGNCNFTCASGKLDCVSGPDGCESDMSNDTTCGSCGNDCTSTVGTNAGPGVCVVNGSTYSCSYASCNAGFQDCTNQLGCETDVTSNVGNCGSCGNNCQALPGVASATCTNSACVIQRCLDGFDNCDGDASNGCEARLDGITACGSCNNSCSGLPNLLNPQCTNGSCTGQCSSGFDNCGSGTGVGCPNDLSADAQNCGVCGNTCSSVKNAAVSCANSNCTYSTCNNGFQDCDNDKANGCESPIQTDKNNCGACNVNCEVPNGFWASATCSGAQCSLTCQAGYADCDTDYKTGCEVNTNTDVKNCGSCLGACNLKNAASQACVNGGCQVTNCSSGFALCSNPATAGCLINLNNDPNNCNACDNKCGALPNVAAGITCASGVCQVTSNCAAGFNDCDGNVANGCELPVSVCTPVTPGSGVCSVAQGYTNQYRGFNCATLGGGQNVLSSTCSPVTNTTSGAIIGTCFIQCANGFSDCDGNPTNGCETVTASCDSSLTSGSCNTALLDPQGNVSCTALTLDPVLNQTVAQGAGNNVCNSATGRCTYTCSADFFDCDGSAKNGCEIDKRRCPTNSQADCVFNNNTRCGAGVCADCTKLSGTQVGSTCQTTAGVSRCVFTCPVTLCNNTDGDWTNGCEMAQFYRNVPGVDVPVDCSKDIDLTNVLIVNNQPVYCDGNASSPFAGRCLFSCKPGFADCDGSPFNGCETQLGGACQSCEYQADISCGKNKCVDCTLLEGTLGTDYANGRWASASASTCVALEGTANERVTDFVCDTSVHRLNPRFDPPTGSNGACQSELCRDLDGDWSNGCESAQQYGRGRFYYYGDSTNLDSYLVPYVPNPYEDRFYEYKRDWATINVNSGTYLNPIVDDIKILEFLKVNPSTALSLTWRAVAGSLLGPATFSAPPFSFAYSAFQSGAVPSTVLSGLDLALLHYAPFSFTDVDEPSEAAELAIIGEPYLTPVDCVLSEWSDWGLCTYADDCIKKDYVLQTRIRTRQVITPASGGGVCHLPLVEDFYRFSHRNSASDRTAIDFNNAVVVPQVVPNTGNRGADWAHGGGFPIRVDYTGSGYDTLNAFDVMKVLHWNSQDWSVSNLWGPLGNNVNNPQLLSWTGVEQTGTNGVSADLAANPDQYGRLLTCVAVGTCPDTNAPGVFRVDCNVTAWSAWSACSATCDGDWAGGVRIRTRTVLVGAAAKGECFVSEFDPTTGLPLIPNAGMLYEEDWQCNDHSCSSYNCSNLKNAAFAAQVHIDLGADKITPTCDGRDWPAYVKDIAFVDANRDGRDDNTRYQLRGPQGEQEWYEIGGNFPLWNTIYNFSYEYRWPGHCLYECEEGWFDCDHDPRNGCETSGDFCSLDVEFGSPAQLKHPLMPWEHPHGECTVAWKHDPSGVVPRDCDNFNQEFDNLRNTRGVCVSSTGLCDLTCDEGFANCNGDGCVRIDDTYGFCGKACVQCDQLNLFQYGYQSRQSQGGNLPTFECVPTEDRKDYECKPRTQCQPGCTDEDGDRFNGCETAVYEQWPYPDVAPMRTEMDQWSAWTPCTHSDDCGYLWDLTQTDGVFRSVPIQTRYRRPTQSAYNGGWYPNFAFNGRGALKIDGVTFPTDNEFNFQIGLTPALDDIRGVPLVQTPFYEVRVCAASIKINTCVECTNQLVGVEEHCQLSAWSDWSACSAECIDRISDPVYRDQDPDFVPQVYKWDLDNSDNSWVTDRVPYQIRTRTVVKPARLGGRCPPPGDTWQLTEALSNVFLAQSTTRNPNMAAGGLADDISVGQNDDMSAKASYLVDVRKCNTDKCQYPEDCDALNYWYPGHFATVVTCASSSSTYNDVSRCVANTGFAGARQGCATNNGYCDTYNADLRDGCDTYVYATQCGDISGDSCSYDDFVDCTLLPGVMTPYAAPCVVDPTYTPSASFADMKNPNADDATHICDIRWACNATLCTNEAYTTGRSGALTALGWKDGCEVARRYTYPFVTVKSSFAGNGMTDLYTQAQNFISSNGNNANAESQIVMNTFWDSRNRYTMSATIPTDNSIEFSFDCRGFLFSSNFCGDSEIVEPVNPQGEILDENGDVVRSYRENAGCHLSGSYFFDAYNDLGFGCNGDWRTPNAGMCTLTCAAFFYDADMDPRNGCETDVIDRATPEDKYVWVGNCRATNNVVDIKSDSSCGADKCVDCRALPGTKVTGVAGTDVPTCLFVEESFGKIPVLNDNEYYSIQYACGVESAQTQPSYSGKIDFNDNFCNDKCADGDGDWRNGCEQGRGYTGGASGYVIGGVYDALFDRFDYSTSTDSACAPNMITGSLANTNTPAGTPKCDSRASGFEFPVPGAWFYTDVPTLAAQDTLKVGRWSRPASDLDAFLAAINGVTGLYPAAGFGAQNALDVVTITSKRAFDCSILYSTELLYGPASVGSVDVIQGKYALCNGGSVPCIWTYGQVHHINVSAAPLGRMNNVCNLTTGLCNYVCESGWDDYDLDPSNGCEADLSGPCGSPVARGQRKYTEKLSCGPDCVDCSLLPGSYQLPTAKSECLAVYPWNFVNSVQAKGDFAIRNVRFVHACTTEFFQPNTNDNTTGFQNIVCDPTLCFDANFQYQDGCELAVGYPKAWASLGKVSYNHWYSPIVNTVTGRRDFEETTYYVRQDGFVVIGRNVAPSTGVTGEYWAPILNLADTANGYVFRPYDVRNPFNSAFQGPYNAWNLWDTKNWGNLVGTDYNIFPFVDTSAAWDCSLSKAPSGMEDVDIGGGRSLSVSWAITSSMDGPWFHVNQSRFAQTQCNAGQDPGAIRNLYTRGAFGINPLKYCALTTQQDTAWLSGSTSKLCFDLWIWPGAGLCKLACETNWADGDYDPSNGCESYMPNGLPYPNSRCGTAFNDPQLDLSFPSGKYNYNQAGSCGAGLCLNCRELGGVNQGNSAIKGAFSACFDGGDDWFTADTTTPVNAIRYPGDFMCSGVINQAACLRIQLSYKCQTDATLCPLGSLWARSGQSGTQTSQTNAGYLQVCADRDSQWETGCEVALGYNLEATTAGPSSTSVVNGVTIVGNYKRSMGVRPNWDSQFNVITWGTGANIAQAGFDCEILRLLPRRHTHVRPQELNQYAIECSEDEGKAGPGTCSFTCDDGWSDCDQNPWNGCESADSLCGGFSGVCNQAQQYPSSVFCGGSNIPQVEIARSTFCDGNQLPYDDWRVSYDGAPASTNNVDSSMFDDRFEIQDWGMLKVDVLSNYVNPWVSRYTIKGLWDNVDIDYVCRVWLVDFYTVGGITIRSENIPEDANIANGRCVVDCRETGGYTDCNGVDSDGCEPHNTAQSCRTPDGGCTNCNDLPGTVKIPVGSSKCLSVVGLPARSIQNFTIPWQPNAFGIQGASVYTVSYGNAGGLPSISTEFPQCDTRGQSALGTRTNQACDDNLCRDYDGDWENGCEFPMAYTALQRADWETKQALYTGVGSNQVVFDGFDCSWISDPQPDAGGRNYGGKTWAQKFHVNTDLSRGGSLGECIGTAGFTNAGKCDIMCETGWTDCDGDPSNGCETDNNLCENCVFAKKYPDGVLVNCSSLTDSAKGFIPFTIAPTCNGREGEDGMCSHYMCNIFNGYCDSGLGKTLTTIGCIDQTADDNYCGADWNWRDIRGNMTTVPVDGDFEYEAGRMIDYGNFDGTGRCATCNDLDGYMSDFAYCENDATVAGHTFDKKTYYKPAASGWIDNSLGYIEFQTAGNTVGDYLCQLHGALGSADDGACDRNLCVDEDYYWANGCETAVNYPGSLFESGSADAQRALSSSADFGFDYHFAFNDVVYGRNWPYNAARDGVQTSGVMRSSIRGVWCPFLQFWSLSTDNYVTGDCNVFPCPHFDASTVNTWITCVNNATAPNAGECNFVCNTQKGWEDCDDDPMTGCETDIFNDGTCGSDCEKIECNALPGINPFYWSECVGTAQDAKCDLSVCVNTLCRNNDNDWTTGCETAVNYPNGATYNCGAIAASASEMARLHLATVEACNGEPGNHWAGKCEFTCEPGWVDCDLDFANGCEHDGSLCQDCTKALGYVTYYDGAEFWQFWGPASGNDMFYSVVYGSYFNQNTLDLDNYSFVADSFSVGRRGFDQFSGPDVAYSRFHVPYVAAFDCSELRRMYPDHFTAAAISCDADVTSPTAGRCVYACDASKGYFDCDGDPRNGCEHQSMHEACGASGACRNCYYMSGVDYPVDTDGNGVNDGSRGPYGRGGRGAFGTDDSSISDVYADNQVRYFGANRGLFPYLPDANTSPLRLGCIKLTAGSNYTCNLDTCVVQGATFCTDQNQGELGWRDGCELALGYNFNASTNGNRFDCSTMGPDVLNNDAPRPTNIPGQPSFHVRQVVGTVGCDAKVVSNTHPETLIRGKGAWRYVLARTGRSTTKLTSTTTPPFTYFAETEGRYAFDYDGLAELFSVNYALDLEGGDSLDDLDTTVANFVLHRVRGGDRQGTCYYECEYGYEDCNGDPRDGCEIKVSACVDRDGEFGWDWANRVPFNGCELALGYSREELGITDPLEIPVFPCTDLLIGKNVDTSRPVYCRGGQDGVTDPKLLGKCQFTCAATHQDCDGDPSNGCETPVSDTACGCVNCKALPGTLPTSDVPQSSGWTISLSSCNNATRQCTVPCNNSLCEDVDQDWTNGCEVAKNYGTPRGATAVGPFDCTIWAKDRVLAKKHHINLDLLETLACDGRRTGPEPGTCNYESACLQREDGGLHDYQDCNGDPRDGCEDTNRWCQLGASAANKSRVTLSDKCSKAANYFRSAIGFDARDELIDNGASTNQPTLDCYTLGNSTQTRTVFHIDISQVYPYCDRNPANLDTRGDCVFECLPGFENCNGLATDGCEANISQSATCDNDCVNCNVLPGVDRLQPLGCIPDTAAGPGEYKCQFTCPGGNQGSNCADRDGKWQNGCERANNGDTDDLGIFVNQGDPMDCSAMDREAKVNPELFRHHLHIDLSVVVPTSIQDLPAGTIFCNNDIVTNAPFGKCYFMCIPGFVNGDGKSFNGCELAVAGQNANEQYVYNPTPNPALPANGYRFIIPGVPQDIPGFFGGYMIGDYEVEYFMAWLNTYGRTLSITLPINVQLFNLQLSPIEVDWQNWGTTYGTPGTAGYPTLTQGNSEPILWY